jgi:hypothetical protein
MSRREIVVLISRAIAILTLTTALIDLLINLPYQVFLLIHQLNFQSSYAGRLLPVSTVQWAGLIVSNVRMVALFVVGSLFWRCGPRIEQLFSSADAEAGSNIPQ